MTIRDTVLVPEGHGAVDTTLTAQSAIDRLHGGHALYRRFGKRAFDIVFALASLPILLPLLAVMYFIVRRDGGPFLFSHPRIGRDGKEYGCLKIRTMVTDAHERLQQIIASDPQLAEEWHKNFKLRDDPRVTKLGRVLRATSFDELPQVFNILKGDMSVVGPRPITEVELDLYGDARMHYESVRPGLTGPWQITGRRQNDFDSRAALDSEYVSRLSLGRDLAIILKTIPEVLNGHGR